MSHPFPTFAKTNLTKLMNQILLKVLSCFTATLAVTAASFSWSQTPELLYYKFDEIGTTVTNEATAPPVGTATATIMGSITQGSTGQCGGALIGSGNSASTDYLNTGWATSVSGSWTISMWTQDITASTTLFYIFGDNTAGSFRCFTNGVAGANNWILRGPFTDVLVNGGATVAPHVTTFVYDQAAGFIYAYLDGNLVSTVAQTPFSLSGTGPFKVMGYSTNVGAPANGLLDEFRFYDHALTAQEVMDMTPFSGSTETVTACDSYLWAADGNTYTTSGMYTDTVAGSLGCDSILTLDLTVNYSVTGTTDTIMACDSFIWAMDGNTYTTGGVYYTSIPASNGCDSVFTLDLTISNSSSSTLTETALDSYTSPGGNVYTASGIYVDTLTNAAGCDSLITINLTVDYTGLEEVHGNSVVVYPNPGQDYLFVQGSENLSGLREIYISAVHGEKVMILTSVNEPIFIADLPTGTYFLNFLHEGGINVIRFVKE